MRGKGNPYPQLPKQNRYGRNASGCTCINPNRLIITETEAEALEQTEYIRPVPYSAYLYPNRLNITRTD